ncbi:hypothetical protein KAR91_11950 [Candidatus Pacearchaeota archaeon]|nr:hypothetical protein [Candidatus Pacearchaeota archaeon]
MFEAKCKTTCTTPTHGYVEEGQTITFDIPKWDLKKFSYLKHFDQVKKAAKATFGASVGVPGDPSGANAAGGDKNPPTDPLNGKKFSEMTPDDIENVTAKAICGAVKLRHGIEMSPVGTSKVNIMTKALKVEAESK